MDGWGRAFTAWNSRSMPFEVIETARGIRGKCLVNGMVERAARTRAATPGTYPFIERQQRSIRDGGEAMSLRFL